MEKLSVVIITFNEENNIGRCIDSVKTIADEIIVLDSFSTDATVTIAREKGAIVKEKEFRGYIEKKNDALALACNPYVLSLDADETLDDALVQSVSLLKEEGFSAKAYNMNRCTCYCGQFIRHGSWYPDRKIRLFDKRFAKWGGTNPHDRVELDIEAPVVHLKGDILHYSYHSISDHAAQNNKLSSMAAAAFFNNGRQTSIFKIIFNPIWSFVQGYLIRLGFLDGFYGFIIAIQVAHLTFLKHVKLYLLHKTVDGGKSS